MYRLALALILTVLTAVAQADAVAGKQKSQFCLICHKLDNPVASVPTLEGQTRVYLRNQILAFKEKRRSDQVMQSNVMALTEEDIRDIVDYFASSPPMQGSFRLDPEKIANGASKSMALKCAECHKPDYSGEKEVPRLAGMDPQYVASQIEAFSEGKRMHPLINPGSKISSAGASDLAQYFAQIK